MLFALNDLIVQEGGQTQYGQQTIKGGRRRKSRKSKGSRRRRRRTRRH
jgi:hypothetical protein